MANEALYEWLKNGDTAALNPDLLREAAASVRLDKGERGQTFAADDLDAPAQPAKREPVQPAGQGMRGLTVEQFEKEQPVSEAAVQRQIIDALLLDGWQVWRINSGATTYEGENGKKRYVEFVRWAAPGFEFTAEGNPDVLAIKGSYAMQIETKTADGTLRPGQVRCLDAAEQCGNLYVLARSVDDIAPYLSRVRPQ